MTKPINPDFLYAIWTDTKGFEIGEFLTIEGHVDLIKQFAVWSSPLVKKGWMQDETLSFLKTMTETLSNQEVGYVLENDFCKGMVEVIRPDHFKFQMIYNQYPQDVGAPDIAVIKYSTDEASINLPNADKAARNIAADAFKIMLGSLRVEDGEFFTSKKPGAIVSNQGVYKLINLGGTRRRFEYAHAVQPCPEKLI